MAEFIRLAINGAGMVKCSCKNCWNCFWKQLDVVEVHIIDYRIYPNYQRWICSSDNMDQRGRPIEAEESDEMAEVLFDLAKKVDQDVAEDMEMHNKPIDNEVTSFDALFENLQFELWPGCSKMLALLIFLSST